MRVLKEDSVKSLSEKGIDSLFIACLLLSKVRENKAIGINYPTSEVLWLYKVHAFLKVQESKKSTAISILQNILDLKKKEFEFISNRIKNEELEVDLKRQLLYKAAVISTEMESLVSQIEEILVSNNG